MNVFNGLEIFILLALFGKYCCTFQRGKKVGNPFAALKGAYGLKQCIRECLVRKQCQIVGFHDIRLRCDLGYIENVVNTSDSEFSIAKREDLLIYQNLLGNCANHDCYTGRKCEVMNTGRLQCITTDCGPPPVISNASITSTQSIVGMSVNYTCHPGTVLVGNADLTCKSNGLWSDVNFECKSVCSGTDGYTMKSSGNNFICFKIYAVGRKTTLFTTAVQQCAEDGGRLVILNDLWKINAITSLIEQGAFFVNGQRSSDGTIKTSDGKDLIQFGECRYDIATGEHLTLRYNKVFTGRPAGETYFGFICEKVL